jgi:hypothetical protein
MMSVVHWLVALCAAIVAFSPVVFAFWRKSLRTHTVVVLNLVSILWMAVFPHLLIIPVLMWFWALVLAFRD